MQAVIVAYLSGFEMILSTVLQEKSVTNGAKHTLRHPVLAKRQDINKKVASSSRQQSRPGYKRASVTNQKKIKKSGQKPPAQGSTSPSHHWQIKARENEAAIIGEAKGAWLVEDTHTYIHIQAEPLPYPTRVPKDG